MFWINLNKSKDKQIDKYDNFNLKYTIELYLFFLSTNKYKKP